MCENNVCLWLQCKWIWHDFKICYQLSLLNDIDNSCYIPLLINSSSPTTKCSVLLPSSHPSSAVRCYCTKCLSSFAGHDIFSLSESNSPMFLTVLQRIHARRLYFALFCFKYLPLYSLEIRALIICMITSQCIISCRIRTRRPCGSLWSIT